MKQAEFESLTRGMGEAMLAADTSGRITGFNPAAQRLLGAGCREGADFDALLNEVARTGDNADPDTVAIAQRRYRLFSGLTYDGEEKPAGCVYLFGDVTELSLADKTRREFTANVSHELKTPLTAILGYAEIMKNGIAPDNMLRDFAGRIHSEATRLIQLVNDILHLTRLDEGLGLMPTEEVPLLSMAREIGQRLSHEAGKKNILIEFEGSERHVRGDAQMLEELCYNLMDNAIKYNKEGGSVKVRVYETNAGRVLEVEDTGIGIDSKYHERVFERFFRVDKSRSRESGGTGLGLSIVKHAAMFHHANIDIDSTPGKGTKITVTFPLGGN